MFSDIRLNETFNTVNQKKIIVNFSTEDLSFQLSKDGLKITLQGTENLYVPDQPKIPCFRKEINLANNEVVTRIRIKKLITQEVSLPKVPLQFNEKPKEYSREKSSTEDLVPKVLPDLYPTSNFTYSIAGDRRTKTLSLFINPVYIDHQKLVLSERMEIQIDIGVDPQFQSFENPIRPISIILAPDELNEQAKDLQDIHSADGYDARVVLLSQIQTGLEAPKPYIEGTVGFLDASDENKGIVRTYDYSLARKIQQFLMDLSEKNQVQYLTLLGDATYIPPSQYFYCSEHLEEFPNNTKDYDSWVPTDFLYSSPHASGKSVPLTISVGRLPVRDRAEATHVVEKIRRYRKNLSSSWFRNFTINAGFIYNDGYIGELSTIKVINQNYLEGMTINKLFKSAGLCNKKTFMDSLKNDSAGFLWANGHGGGDNFSLEKEDITSKDIMDLPDKDELPIIFSEGCGNGAFDTRLTKPYYQTNSLWDNPTSFSESVLLSKGGGIAYIGGVRGNTGAWEINYDKGVPTITRVYMISAMMEYLMECYHNEEGALGDIVRKSLETFALRDWYESGTPTTKSFFGFTLQGDPTLKLPFFKNPNKRSIPQILTKDSDPLNEDNIPLFSIDDGYTLQAKSDSENLSYIMSHCYCHIDEFKYLDHPVITEGEFDDTSKGVFQETFHLPQADIMCIRVIADDGKESRIVFLTRYNHDLMVEKSYNFQILQKNEHREGWIEVFNEGLSTENNLAIKITTKDKIIKEEFISSIPILSSRMVYFSYPTDIPGDFVLYLEAPKLPGETYTLDNQIKVPFQVRETKILRIGVLGFNKDPDRSLIEDNNMIPELNQRLREENRDLELCVIPVARDKEGKTNLDRLDLDAVLFFSSMNFYTPYDECFSDLTNFSKKGGWVFGFLCLGDENYPDHYRQLMHPFFGISAEENFKYTYYWQVGEPSRINIKEESKQLFPKDFYDIETRFTLTPINKKWKSVKLKGARVLGVSNDSKFALFQYGNRVLFSGGFNSIDFEQSNENIDFFVDILEIMKRSDPDLIIEDVTFDLPIGTKNTPSTCTVIVRNRGIKDISNIPLLFNGQDQKIISILSSNSNEAVNFAINTQGFSGNKTIEIDINPDRSIPESSFDNNHLKTDYPVLDNDDPDSPPKITFTSKNGETVHEMFYTINGQATLGSTLKMGTEILGQNKDGSFQKLVTLAPGKNQFSFVAQLGSLSCEPIIYEITYIPLSHIKLRIGENRALIDDEIMVLDSEPILRKGTTFVPLRFISTAVEASINWNPARQEIQIISRDHKIYLWIGQSVAKVVSPNGTTKEVKLSSPPIIIKGRTLVPIRFIAESFGFKVTWDQELKSVTIAVPKLTKESKPLFKNDKESTQADGIIIDSNKQGKMINPSCFDRLGDILYVSMNDGIYRYNHSFELKSIIPWDAGFIDEIGLENLKLLSSTPNRKLLRVTESYFIISNTDTIYILENPSGQYIRKISGINYSFIDPFTRFGHIQDIEVKQDTLYVIDEEENLSFIELATGEVKFKQFVPCFPQDIVLSGDTIFITSLYNDMYTVQSDGSKFKKYTFPFDTFLNSLIVTTDEIFYLNTYYPTNQLLRFTIQEDQINILNQQDLPTGVGHIIERMTINQEEITVLSYQERMKGALAYETNFLTCNQDFKILKDLTREDVKSLTHSTSYLSLPGKVWITEEGDFIVSNDNRIEPVWFRSMGYDSNPSLYRIFDSNGNWKKDLSTFPIDNQSYQVDSTYIDEQTISAFYKQDKNVQTPTYIVRNFSLTKGESETKTIFLKPKSYFFDPVAFTQSGDNIAVADQYSRVVVLFDLSTGEEVKQIKISGNQAFEGINHVSKISIHQNHLYVMDSRQKIINIYSNTDGVIVNQIKIPHRKSEPSGNFDFQVLEDSRVAILDKKASQFYFWENGVFVNQIQLDHLKPSSFFFRGDILLVNDLYHQRVVVTKIPRENPKQGPVMNVSQDNFHFTAFSNNPIQFQIDFQIKHTEELLVVKSPDWIKIKEIPGDVRSGILTGFVVPNQEPPEISKEGIIQLSVAGLTKEIKVRWERKVNKIQFFNQSNFFVSSSGSNILKYPILLENSILYVPVQEIEKIFNTSLIYEQRDLVKKSNGALYLALNHLFDKLNKKYRISTTEAWVEF